MKKILISLMCVCACVSLIGCGGTKKEAAKSQAKPVTVRIAAAASLEKTFTGKLIPMYVAKNPNVKIEGTYDSSGKLQMQIENGLKADIFMSAAMKQMNALKGKGFMEDATVMPLLENKLVLIVGNNAKTDMKEFKDFVKAKQPAIGDPKSVPAGQYAKEALTKLNLWQNIEKRASLGTNVTQVLNWVAEGSADAGLVYATDAASTPKVKVIAEAPQGSLAKPVIYPIGMLKQAPEAAEAKKFLTFLESKEALEIFQKAGFAVAKK